ncbi:hypothetical protein MK805_10150 [Shimazuella sp. AN120528]|uniref:hypothetical protein n=1 Tax=Shimazuella soli TaxID=1892854 RepID=UPI001F100673|nr:hypothetical protein [Shimazuella soli]MCH5585331.1 hypothetical protein [Shimazuella soli]
MVPEEGVSYPLDDPNLRITVNPSYLIIHQVVQIDSGSTPAIGHPLFGLGPSPERRIAPEEQRSLWHVRPGSRTALLLVEHRRQIHKRTTS